MRIYEPKHICLGSIFVFILNQALIESKFGPVLDLISLVSKFMEKFVTEDVGHGCEAKIAT